ncbi:MAG TPA: hydrogenase nickel incorporation protein HypB [Gemmatimonadales bacterium]|nr:hydrogenase nickel incorporation protein HypB [Gemmatimonadales bacterium]
MHEIDVKAGLLAPNDAVARENRQLLAEHGIYAVNLMSAPGSGKTSLLERVLPALVERHRVGVVEGDIVGSADKDRLGGLGCPVHQINTGAACHLDARMVHHVLHHLAEDGCDVVVIENVGNLVCPAEFDLGEDDAVMLLSVTEGHDKPKKYPLMFRRADLVVMNKVDLLDRTDFDPRTAETAVHDVHPGVAILSTSCRTGAGIEDVVAWLEWRIASKRAATKAVPELQAR